MTAKNIQDSKRFNYKLIIVLIFVAIFAIFIKESFYKYYDETNHSQQNLSVENNLSWTEENTSEENSDEPIHCSSIYLEIEEMMDEMNHCVSNDDCDVLILGADYIEFGCYHFINKNENKQKIFEKMDKYNEDCGQIINKCASSPKAKCHKGECVMF